MLTFQWFDIFEWQSSWIVILDDVQSRCKWQNWEYDWQKQHFREISSFQKYEERYLNDKLDNVFKYQLHEANHFNRIKCFDLENSVASVYWELLTKLSKRFEICTVAQSWSICVQRIERRPKFHQSNFSEQITKYII